HRPLAGKARRREMEQAGNRAAVEALPAHDLRLAEGRGVDAFGRERAGPLFESAACDVERVDLARSMGAVERERQLGPLAMELRVAHAARGDLRCRQFLEAARVEQAQLFSPVDV